MRTLSHWNEWSDDAQPVCLAIGAFDGIHVGHQTLLRLTREAAEAAGGQAWLLTFDPHPARILRPDSAPPLLTSIGHKLRLIEAAGLDGCIVHPFDAQLAALSPEAFWQTLVAAVRPLHTLVVGPNWRFGQRAAGDVDRLRALAEPAGIAVRVPEPVQYEQQPVSSTRIREAVELGLLHDAEAMLGRPFSLLGTVTTGHQFGRELGFPTANIHLQQEARPPTGVYAVYSDIDGTRYPGAAYLGVRPTPSGSDAYHLLEAHYFDNHLELYGKEIEVCLLKRFRGDMFFENHEALRRQIASDVAQVRGYFEQHPV